MRVLFVRWAESQVWSLASNCAVKLTHVMLLFSREPNVTELSVLVMTSASPPPLTHLTLRFSFPT